MMSTPKVKGLSSPAKAEGHDVGKYARDILLGSIYGNLLVDALAEYKSENLPTPAELRKNFCEWYSATRGDRSMGGGDSRRGLLMQTFIKTFESLESTEPQPFVSSLPDKSKFNSTFALSIAPVAIKYHNDTKSCLLAAYVQSRVTYGDRETAQCAMLFAFLLNLAWTLATEAGLSRSNLGQVLDGSFVLKKVNEHLAIMCKEDKAWLKRQCASQELLIEFPSALGGRTAHLLRAHGGGEIYSETCWSALAASLNVLRKTIRSLQTVSSVRWKFEHAVTQCRELRPCSRPVAIMACQLVGAFSANVVVAEQDTSPPDWFLAIFQHNARSVYDLSATVRRATEINAGAAPKSASGAGWFKLLFGFQEQSPRSDTPGAAFNFNAQQYTSVRSQINSEPVYLIHKRTGGSTRRFVAGDFKIPSLKELRTEVQMLATQALMKPPGTAAAGAPVVLTVEHKAIQSVFNIHCDSENNQAFFQVASQFNCLEFMNPRQTPADGITCYFSDKTQGPDCALAAAPALFYRQYCRNGAESQLNTLAKVITRLKQEFMYDAEPRNILQVRNGYAFCNKEVMRKIHDGLANMEEQALDKFRELQQVGVVTNAEVPFASREGDLFVLRADGPKRQFVHQVLCSALGINYACQTLGEEQLWYPLAKLVLEAQYEATLLLALRRYLQLAKSDSGARGPVKVFLTFVGGGAFQNQQKDIAGAIKRAIRVLQEIQIPVEARGGPTLRICLLHHRNLDTYYKQEIKTTARAPVSTARAAPARQGFSRVQISLLPRRDGPLIIVEKADICRQGGPGRGAVVNYADENLKHGGGVARALKRAGGKDARGNYKIDIASKDWLAKNKDGLLKKGMVAETTAGDMKAKSILHVVGPRVPGGRVTLQHSAELREAVWAVLKYAEEREFDWISIPAISTGIFGFPKKEGAEIIQETCIEFCLKPSDRQRPLQQIRLVSNDDETHGYFEKVVSPPDFLNLAPLK